MVLLGIRTAWKEDLQSTAAELVCGETLRLPGQFLSPNNNGQLTSEFVKNLKKHMQQLKPSQIKRHGEKPLFIFKELMTAEEVFVRHEGQKSILQSRYVGPYKVISRTNKTFTLRIKDKNVPVSIDRLKPAFYLNENIEQSIENDNGPEGITINIPIQENTDLADNEDETEENIVNFPVQLNPTERQIHSDIPTSNITTRSGRRINLPVPFRDGLS